MPRLNHGTLLENLVVLEVARVLTRRTEATVEFACSFAMPPLTQCWHRTQQEPVNNPRFNAGVMANLLNGTFAVGAPTSYSALLRDCLANAPSFPVVPYALTDATQLCEYGGPNGALLAALLTTRRGQSIRIWSNDLADHRARYRGTPVPDASTECPRTTEYAAGLSPGNSAMPGVDLFCGQEFPDSVPAMASWCGGCAIRIGFLDPDSYVAAGAPVPGQVDRSAHCRWLTDLHRDAETTAGVMFFASQYAPGRPALIAAFHDDARDDYPRSVVFCHGNYMVGVKLRCHETDRIHLIIDRVRDAWVSWSEMVGRDADGLSWDLN
ncbi:MAG TPA: hypothetical protein VJ739_17020 [Gemmataceae bacterium]|nr:hypothetical protein [Gemmataceae bacterium]